MSFISLIIEKPIFSYNFIAGRLFIFTYRQIADTLFIFISFILSSRSFLQNNIFMNTISIKIK